MIPLETILTALLGAGGAGGLAGLWNIIKSARQGKLENEETLIRRLDDDNRRHQERANAAETRVDEMEREVAKYRTQRYRAQNQAAKFRLKLISTGADPDHLEPLVEFDD